MVLLVLTVLSYSLLVFSVLPLPSSLALSPGPLLHESGGLIATQPIKALAHCNQLGPTIDPSAHNKPIMLGVVSLVPPPEKFVEAEDPLWNALEGRDGLTQEHTKPLGRG